jgi:hypothetical protein
MKMRSRQELETMSVTELQEFAWRMQLTNNSLHLTNQIAAREFHKQKTEGVKELIHEVAKLEEDNGAPDIAQQLMDLRSQPLESVEDFAEAVYNIYEEHVGGGDDE